MAPVVEPVSSIPSPIPPFLSTPTRREPLLVAASGGLRSRAFVGSECLRGRYSSSRNSPKLTLSSSPSGVREKGATMPDGRRIASCDARRPLPVCERMYSCRQDSDLSDRPPSCATQISLDQTSSEKVHSRRSGLCRGRPPPSACHCRESARQRNALPQRSAGRTHLNSTR